MFTSDHQVNLPADAVKWFRQNYGKDASLSWLLGHLLQSFVDLHEEKNITLVVTVRESAARAKDIISSEAE